MLKPVEFNDFFIFSINSHRITFIFAPGRGPGARLERNGRALGARRARDPSVGFTARTDLTQPPPQHCRRSGPVSATARTLTPALRIRVRGGKRGQTSGRTASKHCKRGFWGTSEQSVLMSIIPPTLSLQAACFTVFQSYWIPFGDHPLKLERYRED